MDMKTASVIVVSLFFFISSTLGQHVYVSSSEYNIYYQKHSGQAILNNGKTQKGIFKHSYLAFTFKYFDSSGKFIKRYKESDIKSITLAGSDTSISNKDSTYFIKINKPYLYRQLTSGAIEIYDKLINVNEKKGLIFSTVIVLEDNKVKKLNTKRKILAYIEEKLNEKNIPQHFNSVKEAIHYLNYSHI
ncbi:MAG TPA: hypothetical protein VHD35_09745 [Chitinophagaceae bacterium]|nr:hypothetical protein [Chitinophagaceae bacterium]